MDAKILRNKRAQLRRGKKSLIKRVYKFEQVYGVDIAIIMCKNGQYDTYRSMDQESWLPTMK